MSDQSDFEERLAAIQAIPSDAVKTCPMPIGIYAQEAENLFHWANQDAEALAGAGLKGSMIGDLVVRVGVLREAEARWQREYGEQKEAEAEWATESPKAYALRDELLRAFRYAFRNQENLLQHVSRIAEGDGHADMIQDLTSLSVLGRENTALLEATLFDLSKLEQAADTADAIASLLAKVNGDRLGGNDGRHLRDQAFTYLKELVDEVRACGKYVFFDNNKRLQGYCSAYYRQKKRGAREKVSELAES